MEIKDIAALFITATGKIEFYWNFYTVMMLALIGWLVSTNQAFRPGLKLLITVGYTVFALMNFIGLWGSYTFAEALRLDLLTAVKLAPNTLTNAQLVLAERSFMTQRCLALFIHVIIGGFILITIWSRHPNEQISDADH